MLTDCLTDRAIKNCMSLIHTGSDGFTWWSETGIDRYGSVHSFFEIRVEVLRRRRVYTTSKDPEIKRENNRETYCSNIKVNRG